MAKRVMVSAAGTTTYTQTGSMSLDDMLTDAVAGSSISGTVLMGQGAGNPKAWTPDVLAYAKLISGVVATTGGAILAWSPGIAIVITRVVLYTSVKSTGAANASIGVAANATTSSANLIDSADVGTATVAIDNIGTPGTNGKAVQPMSATQSLTVTGSADTS